jgi:hypothetical protein
MLQDALRGAMAATSSASQSVVDRTGAEREADARVLQDALRDAMAATSSVSRSVAHRTVAEHDADDRTDAEREADMRVLEDALRDAEAAASPASRSVAHRTVAEHDADDRTDAEREADMRVLEDALRGAEAAAPPDLGPRLQSGGAFAEAVPETMLNPSWATCYVEAQLTTRPVIEEWVMRGDREVIASFSAWRRSSDEATGIKCVDTSAEDALQSQCLECAAHDEAQAHMTPFAVHGHAPAEGVLTLSTGSSQCMQSAARGQGFCKSGQLLLG